MSDLRDSDGEHPVEAPAPHPDNRDLWEWRTKYQDAAAQIRIEARILGTYLLFFGLLSVVCFAYVGDFTIVRGEPSRPIWHLRHRDVLVWLVGSVGGSIFAIKWLVHSIANGIWHQDRFLWRIFVPLTGGIYALVVLGLLQTGFLGGKASDPEGANITREIITAFLAGYFADGVSGLLTNVANAIFGKVDKN